MKFDLIFVNDLFYKVYFYDGINWRITLKAFWGPSFPKVFGNLNKKSENIIVFLSILDHRTIVWANKKIEFSCNDLQVFSAVTNLISLLELYTLVFNFIRFLSKGRFKIKMSFETQKTQTPKPPS